LLLLDDVIDDGGDSLVAVLGGLTMDSEVNIAVYRCCFSPIGAG
jgi:hypothetical protein